MNSRGIKAGIATVIVSGAVLVPNSEALAAGKSVLNLPQMGIEKVLNSEYLASKIVDIERYIESEVVGLYSDMAFARVEEGNYLYIKSEPSEESDWNGKLYLDNASTVIGSEGEWTQIVSGDVTGYVKTESIIIEKEADKKAKEILTAKNPGADLLTLDEEIVENSFSYATSREAEEAARRARGQEIVDFATQFVGNPYVWGGTSLTNGADCSGFVRSVYANFGFALPRTSGSMRGVGVEVNYSDAIPGDIICYQGHVGIYAGNGKLVNAIDEKHGIGISSATYANIITVRRLV